MNVNRQIRTTGREVLEKNSDFRENKTTSFFFLVFKFLFQKRRLGKICRLALLLGRYEEVVRGLSVSAITPW